MKWYWALRVIFIAIPAVVLVFFGYQYINPSGELIVDYDFCDKETAYFSGLSPMGRVLELDKSEIRNPKSEVNCFQRMVIDPVYFDVRLSQSYRSVEIEVVLDKTQSQGFEIGVGIDPDKWKWKFDIVNDIQDPSDKVQIFRLDLSEAQFESSHYRFIVSAPDLDTRPLEVKLYNMKLTFTKPVLTSENFWTRIKSLIRL